MKAQKPAEGILKRNDWGNARLYQVTCDCHNHEHDHQVWVEAEEGNTVSVVIYTTTTSKFWEINRWRQMWQLLTRGHIKSEVALSMSRHQALNYARTLEQAVKEVENLPKQ